MVVAVHEHPRLREVVSENRREPALESFCLRCAELPSQLARHVPVGEKAQFPREQVDVVIGQHSGAAREVNAQQRVQRGLVQLGGTALVERLQISLLAHVRKQQEALGEVLRMNRRDVHAGHRENAGHAHELRAALLLGWRVHGDERSSGAASPDPEVATEARVVGGGGDVEFAAAERRLEPFPQLLSAVQNSSGNKALPSHLICAILALAPAAQSSRLPDMSRPTARFPALAIALLCSASAYAQGQGLQLPRATDERSQPGALPITLDADRIEGVSGKDTTAQGNASLRRGDLSIRADSLRYREQSEDVEAHGNVRFERRGDALSGPSLNYSVKDETGIFEEPEFRLAPRVGPGRQPVSARGQAEAIEFLGEDQYRIKHGSFTTCKPGDDGWLVRADELDVDMTRDIGTARGARVYFEGVPVIAAPSLDFSLNNSRKSGFLIPSIGATGKGGPEFSTPYYLNLAPNYDLTLTPRYMEKRGLQIAEQFRYLAKDYNGEFKAEDLPRDRATDTGRSALSLVGTYNHGGSLLGVLNLNKVSDDNYFRDLSTRINITSQATLPREGFMTYAGTWWDTGSYSASARVQRFQVLQDPDNPIVPPYARTPQLTFSALRQDIGGFDFGSSAEFVDFTHPTFVAGRGPTASPSLTRRVPTRGPFSRRRPA